MKVQNAALDGTAGADLGAAPAPWHRWRQASNDIDEQAELLPAWEQAYLQLERGTFTSVIDGVALGDDMGLFRKTTNRRLHKIFATSGGTCALALLTPASDAILFQGQTARAGDLLILPPGRAFDVVTLGRFDVSVATLDVRCLPPRFEGRHAPRAAIVAPSAATRRLADSMQRILAPGPLAPAETSSLKRRLECHVVECLSGPDPSNDTRPAPRQAAVIDAARRLLLSETLMQGEAPPVPLLAARLGVSVRQLHKLFRDRLGLSPRAYAERLRLSRARADLRQARPGTTTVAAIATKWGFSHLGRFASSYRAAFGELPSDTARA